MEERTDAELVNLACTDDKQAFGMLMERYQMMGQCIALRMVTDTETARELMQEAMLQAYLSLGHLQDAMRFKSWFYGIVLNICRNWLRSQHSTTLSRNITTEPWLYTTSQHRHLLQDPQEIVEERELQQIVREAVDSLSQKNRMVALLFYYEHLSLQEIAGRLCISLSAVKNRLLKGREQLRAQLQVIYPEMISRPQRKQKGDSMLKMTVARELIPDNRKLVILVDERQQFALPLWLGMAEGKAARGTIYNARLQEQNALEPLTSDLLANIVQSLGGKLESVTIETLQDNILYATLLLSGPLGQHKIKARIADAITLAIHMQCAIYATADVLEQSGQRLSEQAGETVEQQLDALTSMIGKSSYMAMGAQTPVLTKTPRNLDFSTGLTGWSFMGHPREAFTHYLDNEITRNGKASFSIIGQDVEPAAATFYHEGFQANDYRGKRLRMRIYARTEDIKSGSFILQSRGPDRKITVTTSRAKPLQGTQDWTLSTLVLDVPADADYINFSFLTMGMGQVWLDTIQFDVVDVSVPATETGSGWPQPFEPQNIHFEHGLQHWDLWGSYPQDYERGTEKNVYAEGVVSGYLKAGVLTPRGTGILRQSIRPKEYQGKRIRWSGLLKTAGVEQQAGLYLLLDGAGINDVMEKMLSGTTDWEDCAIEIYVPTGCTQLRFGLILYGQGRVWLAKAQLEKLD